jgi:hypothetical protein
MNSEAAISSTETLATAPPNKSLQRAARHKVLGRGRPSAESTRALPRPRADKSARGR